MMLQDGERLENAIQNGGSSTCDSCAHKPQIRHKRMVNGKPVQNGEFPWIVAIMKNMQYRCTGSLITPRHVITAGHCLIRASPEDFVVIPGRFRLAGYEESETVEEYRVKSLHVHENFDTTKFDNDIGLIELETPVDMNVKKRLICLPVDKYVNYSGMVGTAVGWGKASISNPSLPVIALKVSLLILTNEECARSCHERMQITENMFCAGYLDGGKDACDGDSGGPLQVTRDYDSYELAGIVSWGVGCGLKGYPGVYTKVINYLQWESASNRTGRFLFDEIFGIDVTGPSEADDERLRNCSCECGVTNQEIRIVGGKPTTPHRYPWIARLVYDGKFHCGASLVTNDYVLTAAHCLRRLKRSKIRVVLGDHDQYVNTEAVAVMRAVSTIIRHRNFDMNSYNHDVALLKLRRPVKFSKTIKPVCLPQSEADPAGKEGTVVGWGRTKEGGMLPGEVQEVQVPILSLQQCKQMKYRANRITGNMICAGRGKQDSCQGDSGGPLLVHEGDKLEIAGIVSWGYGCGRPGYPGVYTRVAKYLNWIRINMKESCLCEK
ncbi:transmembrane protease serine 9 [Orussus abietinus]|uniref:transmembrane protease serine 9 n=1 Tax=Orussus abietinus TaxID=222816 RepID=UPI000C715BA8|nr:transmembrane protease serine 9 [Orussus abietinus]